MGRQAEAGLRLFVADTDSGGGLQIGARRYQLRLECHDDRSDGRHAAQVYRSLCAENRADLIFGPYSSGLARAVAPLVSEAQMVMVNHGGASDELYDQGHRLLVGILSPASEYFTPFAALLATLKFWRKRVAIISSRAPFARDVALGLERACAERRVRRRGVRVRLKYVADGPGRDWDRLRRALRRGRINALAASGSFAEDLELMRVIVAEDLSIPVLCCVAAGVDGFGEALGEAAEGIVGPSGWEEQIELSPEIGPTPKQFAHRLRAAFPAIRADYPAAQAYAAGLLTAAALKAAGSIDQYRLRAAFADLRTSTLYGNFAIDRVTGRQIGHAMLLVQWHRGRKVIIEPPANANGGTLELPSGWRLMLASFQQLRLKHHASDHDPDEDP